jgi:hypothetical protein
MIRPGIEDPAKLNTDNTSAALLDLDMLVFQSGDQTVPDC